MVNHAAAENGEIEKELASLTESYVWAAQKQQYDYRGKKEIEEILARHDPESILPQLAQCIGNLSPSRSTLDGKPVPVGLLCYEALTQLVYYEAVDEEGDLISWPGYLSVPASAEQLETAQQAWQKVIQEKTYIYP